MINRCGCVVYSGECGARIEEGVVELLEGYGRLISVSSFDFVCRIKSRFGKCRGMRC